VIPSPFAKQDLRTLCETIRAAHRAVCATENSALDSALEAGAALLSAVERKLIRRGQREEFYRETCGHERVGRRYVYLARNRDIIDAYRTRESDLSIAEALALIRKAKGTGKSKGSIGAQSTSEPAPKTLDGWTDSDIASALLALRYDRFVRVIPASFRPLLEAHAGAQMLRRERER